ncbi:MAG TPA: transposase [Thermoanaerobaculia bacterium]|nr:transposase [Thermoanaerobaculia bacterium]
MPSSHVSLYVHVVFSTKDRFPFIHASWRPRLHEYIGGCIRGLSAVPLEVGGVEDHIHFLASLRAIHTTADLIREVKKSSTKWISETTGTPKFHWQDGYGCFSVCHSHIEPIRAYIRGQEEHHRQRTFQEEYRSLLDEFGISFDEKYLW